MNLSDTEVIYDQNRIIINSAIILLVVISVIVTLFLGEVFLRVIDGYKLSTIFLYRDPDIVRVSNSQSNPELFRIAKDYMRKANVADGVDRNWFDLNPPMVKRNKVDSVLWQRYTGAGRPSRELLYYHREKYVRDRLCDGYHIMDPWLNNIKFNRYIFSGGPDPLHPIRYRLPPAQTLPNGFVTNRWGFRGREFDLNRSKDVIRIAFIGASTTINAPSHVWSYPEYVGLWLNKWGHAKNLDYQFEVINAGRAGFRSDEIAGLLVYELLPFDPDIIIYYEGSNQFRPHQYVKFSDGRNSPKPLQTLPFANWLVERSVIAKRITNLLDKHETMVGEPDKNMGYVEWPKSLDEYNPDLYKRDLFPSQLGKILDDLDFMVNESNRNGSEFILSSFIWMVKDKMTLSLPKQKQLYYYLNKTFWPFTYSHMRRYADFQNRVFKKYANAKKLELIDIDNIFKKDPRLFTDGVHMTEIGIRLRSWLTTQILIPIIEKRIEDGLLPRPQRELPLAEHPWLPETPRLMSIAELKSSCQ